MIKPSTWLVRIEIAVAVVAGLLGMVTVFWHDWIEGLSGWDPDQHSGSLEWLMVAALLAVSLGVGLLARRHLRDLRASGQAAHVTMQAEQ
jgi:hypothetical protein